MYFLLFVAIETEISSRLKGHLVRIHYFPISHDVLCLLPQNFEKPFAVKCSREVCVFPRVFHNNILCKT